MKTERSLEEKQRADREMWEWLKSIPMAKCNPFSHYEALIEHMSFFEKTIKQLKAFIAFLAKLEPTQYFKWMSDAFSRYTPSKQPIAPAVRPVETPTVALPTVNSTSDVPSLPSPTYKP